MRSTLKLTKQIAKNLREVYFGGNWTASNLKDALEGVTWKLAVTRVSSLNTIAILTYHLHYYVQGVTKVLEGGPLTIRDKHSFNHPKIESSEDWNNFLDSIWKEAEHFATLVEKLPDDIIMDNFVEDKHGNYFRNLHGLIEHAHYHLGQIVVLKKILLNGKSEH